MMSHMSGPPGGVPAGWYRDPSGHPIERYWDGGAWTDQTRPLLPAPGAPSAVAPVPMGMSSAGLPQNGMGTAALVLGILGFFCFPVVSSVLAIVFGRIGMTRAEQGLATNGGAAKAGFILGIVGLALGVVGLIGWFIVMASMPTAYY